MSKPVDFELKLRMPGWCSKAVIYLNGGLLREGQEINLEKNGYWGIARNWQPGDNLIYQMQMPVERVYAHPDVQQDAGRVALQRGPIVYCLEGVDHSMPIHRIRLTQETELVPEHRPDFLDGVTVITGKALAVTEDGWQNELYHTQTMNTQSIKLMAIPYFTWDNRQPGSMLVWLPEMV
jgi:hypothetical protein